jgi:serine/threonine-protein kinase
VHRSILNRVIIGDVAAVDDERTVTEKRYKLAPRRLGEMGGLAAEVEADINFSLPSETLSVSRGKDITSVGKYKIVKAVGKGGMGAVYEATDKYNGRRVAIKVLVDISSGQLLARFEREAMIMNELNHPNIVRLYDWGRDNERPYIAMEYLDGITLEDLIRRQGKLSLDVVVAIVKPVTEATYYLHQKGFVRNDIKPNNIMLTTAGRVCLLDFGITKPTKEQVGLHQLTLSGEIIGTPQFMAPEQFRGEPVNERTDIYSLGVILYKLLTGTFPFETLSFSQMRLAHLEHNPVPPSEHVKVPPAIDAVIMKCLEKDQDKRIQSVLDLTNALSEAAEGLPPVDLKSVVNAVRIEVREVEKLDQMHTMMDVAQSMMMEASYVIPPTEIIPGPVPAQAAFVMDTSAQPREESHSPAHFEMTFGAAGFMPSDIPGSYITLLNGRFEDVEFHLKTVQTALQPGYLLENKTSIGRSSANSIVLRDTKISRYQAEITTDGDDWFIEDFNSSLGTFINGERIVTRRLLEDRDKIQVGDFVFGFNQVRSPA